MDKNNLQIKNFKRIDFLVVILFFVGVLSFLFFTGTLSSGYHFIDDHEMLAINSDLKATSFLTTSIDWLKKDLNSRFRPMYYFHRIFELKIFGTNFFALLFYTGLLASLTFSFFYFGARKLKYSISESLLFVFLTFIGSQMAIWWKLGPNETIGMFFLGLSFLFMAKCAEKDKYSLNTILFVIFLIVASLCKESFVIIIPAFILYKIWNEKQFFDISIKKSIQNNLLLILPIAVMIIEMWVIIFIVGTNKIGYAGSTSNTAELINGIGTILTNKGMLLEWLKLLATLLIFYFLSFLFLKFNKLTTFKQSIKHLLIPLAFSFLIVLPNILLHAKSGMFERYLLPATFGIAFLIINILKSINSNILRKVAFLVCIIFVFMSVDIAIKGASGFANEGMQTNALLSTIKRHTQPNSKILLVVDPVSRYEISWSLKIYFSSNGINDLYGYPMLRDYSSDYERGLEQVWAKWFENKNIKDMNGQPDLIIIIDKVQTENFFSQSNLSKLDYENIIENNNPHAVYFKK